ncbi:type II toxin-antitoxin system Phd/YefM family antitoxin [Streptomyces sp. NPDC001073]
MRTYSTRQVQAKTKEILDAAAAGEEVRITRGQQVFKVVLVEGEQTEPVAHGSTDDLLAQLVEQSGQQTDLLRQLVEHKDTVLDDLVKQTKPQPAEEARPATVTVEIPETPPQAPEPDVSPEPSQEELEAAYEYLGIRSTRDGYTITEKGIQSALATVKKAARQDPESAEAKVMRMGAADEGRVEFLLCVQVDKLSKALAKRAAGDPRWLGAGTP